MKSCPLAGIFRRLMSRPLPRLVNHLVLAGLLCVAAQSARADNFSNISVSTYSYFGGDIWANGNLVLEGNLMMNDASSSGRSGFSLGVTGDFWDTYSNITFTGTSPNTTWSWSGNSSGSDPAYTQMTLDPSSVLTLLGNATVVVSGDEYGYTYGNISGNIIFDPANQTISFSSGLVINGTANATTLGLSNITFIFGDAGFVAGFGATATGFRSVALGGNATAIGNLSVALASGNATGLESLAATGGYTSGNDAVALAFGNAYGDNSLAAAGAYTYAYDAVALAEGTATGDHSLAGAGSYAAGTGSVAMGGGSVSVGQGSVALANSGTVGYGAFAAAGAQSYGDAAAALAGGSAGGEFTVALGYNSTAYGTYSIALAGGYAYGQESLAFGFTSSARAYRSVVLGTGLTGNTFSSVTVGHYNANITGNTGNWVATDPAFVVGTGNYTNRANGLVVFNNGNTSIAGSASVAGNSSVAGDTTLAGNLTVNGNVTYTQPSGDVSMGVFGVYGQ